MASSGIGRKEGFQGKQNQNTCSVFELYSEELGLINKKGWISANGLNAGILHEERQSCVLPDRWGCIDDDEAIAREGSPTARAARVVEVAAMVSFGGERENGFRSA